MEKKVLGCLIEGGSKQVSCGCPGEIREVNKQKVKKK